MGSFGDRQRGRDLLGIFLFGLVLRAVLLLAFPVPYGEDAFGRVFFKDSVFLSHWLPLTQLIVYLTARVRDDIFVMRFVFAVLTAAAGCGFYLFLRQLAPRPMALLGALFFSVNSLYLFLSLMPYQDVLFLGLYYAALAFLFQGPGLSPTAWGGLLFGLASLTRYESWFVLPILGIWKLKQEEGVRSVSRLARRLVRVGLYFGWAPAVWLLLSSWKWDSWYGFLTQTPDGRFWGWRPHFDPSWLAGYVVQMVYWLVRFGSPLILLALVGLVVTWRRAGRVHPALRLIVIQTLLLLAFFFFIVGKGQETVIRYAVFPLSVAIVFSVLGLEAAWGWLVEEPRLGRLVRDRRGRIGLGVVVLALLIAYAVVPIARVTAEPEYRDPYLVAHFIDDRLGQGETVLVVADRFRDFSDAAPLLYQRIVAQSRFGEQRILSSGLSKLEAPGELLNFAGDHEVRYLVVFEFEPWMASDRFFMELARSDPDWMNPALRTKTAVVYRIEEWPEMM